MIQQTSAVARYSVRDLILFGGFAVLLPVILAHPYIGALAWVVFGIMNPHRLTWGPAYSFQFSLIIAIVTILGMFFTRDHRKIKGGAPGIILIGFTMWICFTAFFPFYPEPANAYLERVMKIFVMTGVLMLLLHTRRHVELLVWMIVLSLGFYGIKGGLFMMRSGGQYMVMGPDGGIMEGNNALGVGLVVIIPLMMFLRQQLHSKWLRLGLFAGMALCAISVLGTYSRGAFLAVFAMGCVLLYRSTHKIWALIAVMVFALVAVPAMPDHWTDRMNSLRNYEQDVSAMSRITAWQTAFNIAQDRFPMGGGFEWHGPETSAKYSPNPSNQYVAHSIYFQVLGSQGFVGLGFFLLFWMLVWLQCNWIRRKTHGHKEVRWAFLLASMTQVSLVGYAVGGAFLDIAFWDLPYYLYAAVAVTQYVVRKEVSVSRSPEKAGVMGVPVSVGTQS